jgi:predicted PurR-regulated permease PerM
MDKVMSITLYRRLFLIMVSIAGLYFLYRVRIILIPFIFAFFIAYLLNPIVKFVEKRNFPKCWAILWVYLVVFILAGIVIVFGVPHILGELNKLIHDIPKLAQEVQSIMTNVQTRYSRFALPEGIKEVVSERIIQYQELLLNAVRAGTTSLINVISYCISLVIAPVFAFYMLKDIGQIKDSITLTIPRKYRSDMLAIGRDIDEIISAFLRGHFLVCVIVGILTGVGMYLIGLDFALIIGIIAGVAELVPFLGPIIAAVPALSLALLISRETALYAVLVILIVQQLENAVISPKILGRSMGLHPLVVIFTIMAGGELYGLLGILLAVPVAATLKVVLRYIYLKLVDEANSH